MAVTVIRMQLASAQLAQLMKWDSDAKAYRPQHSMQGPIYLHCNIVDPVPEQECTISQSIGDQHQPPPGSGKEKAEQSYLGSCQRVR